MTKTNFSDWLDREERLNKRRRITEAIWHDKRKLSKLEIRGLRVGVQRTVRVPEGKINSLPANLGNFPIYRVRDFKNGCPTDWKEGCYFMPMYPQEAMWINFGRSSPLAVIVGAGNINAITGKPFKADRGSLEVRLEEDQNYVVTPPQPWLDGWKAEDGKVYQFVAAELGSGQTVEGQITGEETIGGIQFIVYEPKKNLPRVQIPREHVLGGWSFQDEGCLDGIYKNLSQNCAYTASRSAAPEARSMGLGRGGEIQQKIYPDPYGLEVWKPEPSVVERLYLVSSEDFYQVTGYLPPPFSSNSKRI